MSNRLEELEKKLAPKEEFVEVMANYYGDKEKIEESLNDTKFIIVARDVPKFDIMDMFQEKYKNNPEVNYKECARNFITNLENLSIDISRVSPMVLARDRDILEKLGFDIRKIIKRNNKTDLPEIANSKEVEKLKNFINVNSKSAKIKDVKYNVDSIIISYNMLKESGQSPRIELGVDEGELYVIPSKNGEKGEVDSKYFSEIKQHLSKKEKNFLNDFFSQKASLGSCNNEYIIKNINEIFNKNYKNIEELIQDESMKVFLNLRNICQHKKTALIKEKNIKHEDFYNVSDFSEYQFASTYFSRDEANNGGYACAFYNHHRNIVGVKLYGDTLMEHILHEVNHAVAGEKGKFKEVGLNEIVNEFLTERVIENMSADKKSKLNLHKQDNCGYTTAINCMRKFLLKYENVLKRGQLGNASENLKNFVGENNYKLIETIGKFFGDINYGTFNVPIIKGEEKNIYKLDEWIKLYNQDPIKASQINENIGENKKEKFFGNVLAINQFLDGMVENYQKFENGQHVDVELDQKPLSAWIQDKTVEQNA